MGSTLGLKATTTAWRPTGPAVENALGGMEASAPQHRARCFLDNLEKDVDLPLRFAILAVLAAKARTLFVAYSSCSASRIFSVAVPCAACSAWALPFCPEPNFVNAFCSCF